MTGKAFSKQEILEILRMPQEEFRNSVMRRARAQYAEAHNVLFGAAMLGYSNVCKNACLYCGMRAPSAVPRYRISPEDVVESVNLAKRNGFHRFFLVAGEDPAYGYGNLLHIVETISAPDVYLSLACGEFEAAQYAELRAAGANEYVIKFEMSQREVFDRLNPSTNFARRMAAIEAVKACGFDLASGNIIDYPGQTAEMIAEDLLLTRDLGVSWAPVVPYLPAKGTPLAEESAVPGSLDLTQKEIAILRLMLPETRITAQQPGPDLSKGLATEEGNLAAIEAGANILFCDLLPEAQAKAFHVIDHRDLKGLPHLETMAQRSGMTLVI